jgi:hypothetical protein
LGLAQQGLLPASDQPERHIDADLHAPNGAGNPSQAAFFTDTLRGGVSVARPNRDDDLPVGRRRGRRGRRTGTIT